MRLGSLFSGYGGLEQAVESVLGTSTAWVSDIDPGACKILTHRYPDVPNLGDITAVDWGLVEPVDVLTGGFPCHDLSPAGKRVGMRPDTRSGLWTHMAYAIDRLRPALVVAENVRGLLSAEAHSDVEPCPWCMGGAADGEPALRALGAVLGDLADLGYDAAWYGLRASDIGAPHGRFRVFVLAWPAATDTDSHGRPLIGGLSAGERDPHGRRGADIAWGAYEPAIRRWADILDRHAPNPTQVSAGWLRDRARRFNPDHPMPVGHRGSLRRFLHAEERLNPAFVEWMMGLPLGHVTDVPGLSRNDQLKALGNGVVRQQAAAALRVMLPLVEARWAA